MIASQSVGHRTLKSSAFTPPKSRLALACSPFLIACLYSAPAFSADIGSPATLEVMGRAPTATTPTFTNKTAAGLNPAVGDQLEASYVFADSDGDAEDLSNGVFQWKAEGSNIANATTKTFTPTTSQLEQFLTFDATPGTNPAITDPARAVAAVTSPQSGAPVLPSRAQLGSEFIKSAGKKSWGDAYKHCASLNERLPTTAELQAMFVTYTRANAVGDDSQGDINNTYGWANKPHWTSINGYSGEHQYVNIQHTGGMGSDTDSNSWDAACIKAGAAEGLPTVTGVSIPNAALGTPVTAIYTYNGNATIPDRSRFQWYTATGANGSGKVPATGSGATTKTYTPVAADTGKYLMIEITPASYDTVVGTMVPAVSTQPLLSPLSVTLEYADGSPVSGRPEVGRELVANVDCGGTCGPLTYQWQVETAPGSGQVENISGATSQRYTPTGPHQGRGLKVTADHSVKAVSTNSRR